MPDRTYGARLGVQVRTQRKLLGLTQMEVAELAGTTQRSVSQVETGKASSLGLYASVCEVLGLELQAVARRVGTSRRTST
jgi:transcriptional regulator with XRE-family HTH domain